MYSVIDSLEIIVVGCKNNDRASHVMVTKLRAPLATDVIG